MLYLRSGNATAYEQSLMSLQFKTPKEKRKIMKKNYLSPQIGSKLLEIQPLSTFYDLTAAPVCGPVEGCTDNSMEFGVCAVGIDANSNLEGASVTVDCIVNQDISANLVDCQIAPQIQNECDSSGGGTAVLCTISINCDASDVCDPTRLFISTPDGRDIDCQAVPD